MSTQASILTLSLAAGAAQILHMGDTQGLTATAYRICDGNGTQSPLWLSTSALGIGITPATILHAYGSDPIIRLHDDATAVATAEGGFELYCDLAGGTKVAQVAVSAGEFLIGTATGTPIVFQTASTDRMSINASGKVGIGTSNATYKLEVIDDQSSVTSPSLLITGNNDDNATSQDLAITSYSMATGAAATTIDIVVTEDDGTAMIMLTVDGSPDSVAFLCNVDGGTVTVAEMGNLSSVGVAAGAANTIAISALTAGPQTVHITVIGNLTISSVS